MDAISRQVRLEVVDDRGQVVVESSGIRFAGKLTRVPALFVEGTELDLHLIVGGDRVAVHGRALEDVTCLPGAAIALEVLGVLPGAGPLDLVPRTPLPLAAPMPSPMPVALPPITRPPIAALPALVELDEEPTGVIGSLTQMPVSEIMQMLINGRKSAVVEVKPKGGSLGVLGLRDGRLVYCRLEDGRAGEDAFFALFAAEKGTFRIRYDRHVPLTNIDRDSTYLLLEAARLWDEAHRNGDTIVRTKSTSSAPEDTPPPRRLATGLFSRFFSEAGVDESQLEILEPFDDFPGVSLRAAQEIGEGRTDPGLRISRRH